MEIILASQSPRRRALLEQMGLTPFRVSAPQIDESAVSAPSPQALVEALSQEKAEAIRRQEGDHCLIIAADTVVCLEGKVLGKPAGPEEAFAMLSALSGRRHQVYTGLTVLRGGEAITRHEETSVRFRALEPQEIRAYIATGEPMDKAGAYGIQSLGGVFVEGIEGDYYNVVGLPICRLGQMLRRFGVDCLAGQRCHLEGSV